MTGHDLYEFIKNDSELRNYLRQALIEDKALGVRRGKKPDPRKRATREFNRFWRGPRGVEFKLILWRKLGTEVAARVMSGRNARIHTAMILAIDDALRELTEEV